jgi:hypothetical protein
LPKKVTGPKAIEDWEAEQGTQPMFEIEAERIGQGYFVRATLPTGEFGTVHGFADKAAAAKWIRCEAAVWLFERRTKQAQRA